MDVYNTTTFKLQPKISSVYSYSLLRIYVADINKQQNFYSQPKRYKQIRRVTLIPDEGPLLETSNLFVSFR